MAVTLGEAAVHEAVDPREAVIVRMFAQESPIMRTMPMKRINGRYYDYARELALPAGGMTRSVNSQWTESSGIHLPIREHLKILGGIVDVDRFITTTDPNGQNNDKRRQTKMKIQALMNEFDRQIIEGSEVSNSNEIIGWRSRCTSSTQLILAGAGGASLTLRKLNELIDAVKGDASKKVLYMNPAMRLKLWDLIDAAAQYGSRYQISKEEGMFGEAVERYGGVRIETVRTEGDNSTIMGFDEDPGDGTSDCTSIYCVRYDEDDGVCGIYNHGGAGKTIMVEETEMVNGQPIDRLLFEGYYGQVNHQPRALARLYGLTYS